MESETLASALWDDDDDDDDDDADPPRGCPRLEWLTTFASSVPFFVSKSIETSHRDATSKLLSLLGGGASPSIARFPTATASP